MKKAVMVLATFIALSVLVSMITVAPLFAVEATKTGPTPKQVPSQKTPPTSQFSKNKVVVHTKFWDIYVNGCTIYPTVAGSNFSPCGVVNPPTSIPIGDLVCKCSYGIKTPPVNEITELDVKTWGTGGKKGIYFGSLTHDEPHNVVRKDGPIYLPQFTWADVQQWKSGGQGNAPKVFGGQQIEFTLKPTQGNIGLNTFTFSVSTSSEYDGTNNTCIGKIVLY